jgi:predicted secreted protein
LRLRDHALVGAIDDYELSFESGERLLGRFLITRLDYAGDYNGERSYTVSLESSGPVLAQ